MKLKNHNKYMRWGKTPEFHSISPISGIKIFVTTRHFKGKKPFSHPVIRVKQVHSGRVIFLKKNLEDEQRGDGLITDKKALVLEVQTADCFPVFIVDRLKRGVGVIHTGWRGSQKKILLNAIKIFHNKLGCGIYDLLFIFGPGIKKCSYTVKKDIAQFFPDYSVKGDDGSICLDLLKFNIDLIKKTGVQEDQISFHPSCTFCDNNTFFSHRRGDKGRNRAWIFYE